MPQARVGREPAIVSAQVHHVPVACSEASDSGSRGGFATLPLPALKVASESRPPTNCTTHHGTGDTAPAASILAMLVADIAHRESGTVIERISALARRVSTMVRGIWSRHRTTAAIGAGGILVVALIAAGLTISVLRDGPAASTTATATLATAGVSPAPTDSTISSALVSATVPGPSATPGPGWAYSDLDGVLPPRDLAHRLPMAIMIDDNAVARPQSGISSASIVYQAYADGGEDRYMFIFQEGTATDIGPVRSARPYYVYWADEYKAALTATSAATRNSLKNVIPANAKYIYNMDDLNGGSCPYHRSAPGPHRTTPTRTRPSLITCAAKKGYPPPIRTCLREPSRTTSHIADRPASQTISIPYRTCTIGYRYDPATDSYLRSVDGKLQTDPANNEQVTAGSVIVLYQTVTISTNSAMNPVTTAGRSWPTSDRARPWSSKRGRQSSARGRRPRTPLSRVCTTHPATRSRWFAARSSSRASRQERRSPTSSPPAGRPGLGGVRQRAQPGRADFPQDRYLPQGAGTTPGCP